MIAKFIPPKGGERVLDMSIARASMDMANVQLATQVQTSVLKNAMDVQKQGAEGLLKSMGFGQNLNVQA